LRATTGAEIQAYLQKEHFALWILHDVFESWMRCGGEAAGTAWANSDRRQQVIAISFANLWVDSAKKSAEIDIEDWSGYADACTKWGVGTVEIL
jgi:hypothetical protein